MIFVVHEWVTTENSVCWTSLCSYSFFSFFSFFFLGWGWNWRERFPKIDSYQWLAHTRIDNMICRGENCTTAAKGTGTFLVTKRQWFVISSPGSFRHSWKWAKMTLGSRLKKKNQFQEDNKSNIYKCFIDQVKDQFGRILTQWRIRDPQKNLYANYSF